MVEVLCAIGFAVLGITFVEALLGACGFWTSRVAAATEDRMLDAAPFQIVAGMAIVAAGLLIAL